ncbi:MAG: glycosyltransferase family 2 protein [Weeksellaceae bacterium]
MTKRAQAGIKVSLIVLNYNGIDMLEEYFTSVFAQTRVPDEIIMLDNASVDGSREYVQKKFPKVTIVANPINEGTSKASNTAFKHASGDYVIFQSNDLKLEKHCVEALVTNLDNHADVGICTSVLMQYRLTAGNKELLVETAGGVMDMFGFASHNHYLDKIKTLPAEAESFLCFGASFIIRRKVFEKIKGFDNTFFTLNDDIDLCWRTRIVGYKVMFSRDSLVYHRGQATLGRPDVKRFQKRFWSARNNLRTVIKNYSNLQILTLFPVYMLMLIAEAGYFLLRGKWTLFKADIAAIGWNIMMLPDTLKERVHIQKLWSSNQQVTNTWIKKSLKLEMFPVFHKAI